MHAFRAYIFCHSLNRLQRGLSAIAELLVYYILCLVGTVPYILQKLKKYMSQKIHFLCIHRQLATLEAFSSVAVPLSVCVWIIY